MNEFTINIIFVITYFIIIIIIIIIMGSVVIKALGYKAEGRGFETPCGEILNVILPVALGPGVYSASNRNEYRKS
jgi:hypothetical protein